MKSVGQELVEIIKSTDDTDDTDWLGQGMHGDEICGNLCNPWDKNY